MNFNYVLTFLQIYYFTVILKMFNDEKVNNVESDKKFRERHCESLNNLEKLKSNATKTIFGRNFLKKFENFKQKPYSTHLLKDNKKNKKSDDQNSKIFKFNSCFELSTKSFNEIKCSIKSNSWPTLKQHNKLIPTLQEQEPKVFPSLQKAEYSKNNQIEYHLEPKMCEKELNDFIKSANGATLITLTNEHNKTSVIATSDPDLRKNMKKEEISSIILKNKGNCFLNSFVASITVILTVIFLISVTANIKKQEKSSFVDEVSTNKNNNSTIFINTNQSSNNNTTAVSNLKAKIESTGFILLITFTVLIFISLIVSLISVYIKSRKKIMYFTEHRIEIPNSFKYRITDFE